MTAPPSRHAERRQLIWQRVYKALLQHAIPDSRFHHDFLSFTPDFRGSSAAVDRLVQLPCYQAATTILATADGSLEELRYRALRDGKKLLVGTYRLRRGFVLLSPQRIGEADLRAASWLDGMERPGVGRHLSLAQLQEEGITVDLCVFGGLAFSTQGVVVWEGQGLFEVQWALLSDIKVLRGRVPVVAVAHACQVVDEAEMGLERIAPGKKGEVQCDYIATPENLFTVQDAVKPSSGVDFDAVDPLALENIPPLQELRGIRMMESIMKEGGFKEDKKEEQGPTAEERTGIDMMEKIMKGFKDSVSPSR
jgi:5-formyltetrahydrofolate cyclo-ligase